MISDEIRFGKQNASAYANAGRITKDGRTCSAVAGDYATTFNSKLPSVCGAAKVRCIGKQDNTAVPRQTEITESGCGCTRDCHRKGQLRRVKDDLAARRCSPMLDCATCDGVRVSNLDLPALFRVHEAKFLSKQCALASRCGGAAVQDHVLQTDDGAAGGDNRTAQGAITVDNGAASSTF